MFQKPIRKISTKEARKLLGKKFNQLSDQEVEIMVELLTSIAEDFVRDSVPDF